VQRGASGRADWFHPRPTFVYNAPRYGPTRTHRLMLLDSYLQERTAANKSVSRIRAMADFVHRHVNDREK
jgi:hypothetical protein